MPSGKDIDTAIKRRDSAPFAEWHKERSKEETRMFLSLLADVIEQDLKKLKKSA